MECYCICSLMENAYDEIELIKKKSLRRESRTPLSHGHVSSMTCMTGRLYLPDMLPESCQCWKWNVIALMQLDRQSMENALQLFANILTVATFFNVKCHMFINCIISVYVSSNSLRLQVHTCLLPFAEQLKYCRNVGHTCQPLVAYLSHWFKLKQ
jgi:hypothetical protein